MVKSEKKIDKRKRGQYKRTHGWMTASAYGDAGDDHDGGQVCGRSDRM